MQLTVCRRHSEHIQFATFISRINVTTASTETWTPIYSNFVALSINPDQCFAKTSNMNSYEYKFAPAMRIPRRALRWLAELFMRFSNQSLPRYSRFHRNGENRNLLRHRAVNSMQWLVWDVTFGDLACACYWQIGTRHWGCSIDPLVRWFVDQGSYSVLLWLTLSRSILRHVIFHILSKIKQ